ncbi:MAG: hypothetical protein RBU37_25500 [Myxococcota bacterium]|jgi:hypothetical protein|nr:hypothetical protein [Myxococcota bacterium]
MAQQFVLSPNRFLPSATVLPVLAAMLSLALFTVLAFGLFAASPMWRDGVMSLGLVAAALVFVVLHLLATPSYRLLIDGSEWRLTGRGGKLSVSLTADYPPRRHGYFLVSTRFASGYQPAILLQLEGRRRPLVVCFRDLEHYYYWDGDDPWTRRYSHPTDLPEATHFLPGQVFVAFAQHLVPSVRLHQRANAHTNQAR